MRFSRELGVKQRYFRVIEKSLNKLFYDLFVKPLIEITQKNNVVLNEKDVIAEAINSGRIYFEDGYIKGKFNADITRELTKRGARYLKTSKAFAINLNLLSGNSIIAITQKKLAFDEANDEILKYLNNVENNLDEIMRRELFLKEEFKETIAMIDNDFNEATRFIVIRPVLTEGMVNVIAEKWKNNLSLYIKNFASEEVLKLRTKVEENKFAGFRPSRLAKIIEEEFNTTTAKAKFLAKQETSLLTTEYNISKGASLGLTRYKWRGAMDSRERQDHKDLEGKIFDFNNPPIVNKKTGKRGHPGQDFGCRCKMVLIVDR